MSHTVRSGNAEPDAGLNRILRLCFAVGFLCGHDFSAGESAWAFGGDFAPFDVMESFFARRTRRRTQIFLRVFCVVWGRVRMCRGESGRHCRLPRELAGGS